MVQFVKADGFPGTGTEGTLFETDENEALGIIFFGSCRSKEPPFRGGGQGRTQPFVVALDVKKVLVIDFERLAFLSIVGIVDQGQLVVRIGGIVVQFVDAPIVLVFVPVGKDAADRIRHDAFVTRLGR